MSWHVPLAAAGGGFVGAIFACYQLTGDWLAPTAGISGHFGYVAIVTGSFGAVCGFASALLDKRGW